MATNEVSGSATNAAIDIIETVKTMNADQASIWLEKAGQWGLHYGVRIIVAVVIVFLGRWIAGGIKRLIKKSMSRRKLDDTLGNFVGSLVYFAVLAFAVIAALSQLGIQTASFVAVIGAATLAIGLALQGSLANFAAGVMMIIFRPFKTGDYVEGAGTGGSVEEIGIFSTILKTPDNKRIIIPNAKLTGDNITNYTHQQTRRLDLVIGVGYGDDLDKVESILRDVLAKEERVLKDPVPTIGVLELADSSVNFAVRPWVKTSEYWAVRFDMLKTIKQTFDDQGINIPFPQRDIHIYEEKALT